MQERQTDPFFEKLKTDIQRAVAEADRGEGISEELVWAELEAEVQRRKSEPEP